MSELSDATRALNNKQRFQCWAGMGLPKGWAENMGLSGDDIGDLVWPIVDTDNSGPVHGRPSPDQFLCWCPSLEKQEQVVRSLNAAVAE